MRELAPAAAKRTTNNTVRKNKNKSKQAQDLKIPLNNGQKMPLLGLATWRWKHYAGTGMSTSERAVEFALENGYRHIDADEKYQNLEDIGRGIASFMAKQKIGNSVPVEREELFITCKLWGVHFGDVASAYNKILKKMGLEYLDLLYIGIPCGLQARPKKQAAGGQAAVRKTGAPRGLTQKNTKIQNVNHLLADDSPQVINTTEYEMHPKSKEGDYLWDEKIDFITTWKQMEKLVFSGQVKGLGLANFNQEQIARLLQQCACKPQLVQFELHPLLQQSKLIEFCKERGIVVSCFGPVGSITTSDEGWSALRRRMSVNIQNLEEANGLGNSTNGGNSSKLRLVGRNLVGSVQVKIFDKVDQTVIFNRRLVLPFLPDISNDEGPMLKSVLKVAMRKAALEKAAKAQIKEVAEEEEQGKDKEAEKDNEQETEKEVKEEKQDQEQKSSEDQDQKNGENQDSPEPSEPKKTSRPPKKKTIKKVRRRSISSDNPNINHKRKDSVVDLSDPASRLSMGMTSNYSAGNSSLKYNEEMKIRSIASSHGCMSSHVISRWALLGS